MNKSKHGLKQANSAKAEWKTVPISGNQTIPVPHLLSLHKAAIVGDGVRPTIAPPVHLDRAGSAAGRPDCGGLDRAYAAFYVTVDALKSEFDCVPTEVDARGEFIRELVMEAWYCLAEQVDASSERQYALIGPLVPDLVFARIDHVTPAAFATNLDGQALVKWQGICDLLVDKSMTLVMEASEVADVVMERILAEIPGHRPIAEIFAEVADAR